MSKKIYAFLFATTLLSMMLPFTFASPKKDINSITAGTVLYTSGHYFAGEPIPIGYDAFGYNYQGHMFKGSYANVYLGDAGFPPYLETIIHILLKIQTRQTIGPGLILIFN